MLHPEMYFADDSRLGRPFAKDPSVIQDKDRYLLYYSIPAFSGEQFGISAVRGWGIGIAESYDLIHWKKIGEVLPQPSTAEANGICAPGALVLNGKIHLFYQTYGNGRHDAICHAISDDGLHFERNHDCPIFRPDGAWNCGRAIDAEVFIFQGRLLLYFATRDPEMKIQMLGVASAPLDSDFGTDSWQHLSRNGPILQPQLPWERDCIEAPTLCQRGDTLYMFYAGGYNNAPQQIGCAASTDGIHWTRVSEQPVLPNGAPDSWNRSESGHPGVFVDKEGQTYLFYQGNNDNGYTWYLSRTRIEWTEEGIPVCTEAVPAPGGNGSL